MTWIIIGSTAARHWYPDWRQPKDIDLLSPAKILSNNVRELVIDSKWHDLAQEIIELSTDKVFADPSILFTLKVSHAYWDIHWDKTLFDIHCFQKRGVELNQQLHDKLVKLWANIHGAKKVSMNKSVDEFFNDAVKRKYPHELLHELAAFNDRPMHEKIRRDLDSVLVDKEMFFDLPYEQQCQTALEEIIVTAIERGNLTTDSSAILRVKAIKHAHFKLCTSMTKGWFAQFLVLNHFHLLHESKKIWQDQMSQALKKLSLIGT